jgi:uncharacterized membrane protein
VALAAVNLALAAYMTGVIWVVQIVLYPLFAHVRAAEWPAYHAAHSRRITPVVAPAMLAHAIVATALLVERPDALAAVNLALAAGLLLVTATVFARLHGRLTPAAVGRLVRLNALRAVAWTASAGVALALVLSSRGR